MKALTMDEMRSSGPRNVQFLLQGEHTQTRFGGAVGVSFALHVATIILAVFVATRSFGEKPAAINLETLNTDLVWLDVPGPGGGGGGGGNRSPEPARKVELPGKEKITVPVVDPPAVQPPKPEEPPPLPTLDIPAQTLASAPNLSVPGTLEGLPVGASQGSGSGSGGGTGSGSGIGSGQGSGLGPGSGGGTGGGVYRPGSGIELPRLLREVKPQYTAEAMRAKIQGTVLLECVVQSDGTIGKVDVVRSLDPTFGLDQEAMKAVRLWRFAPGTRQGQPVAVLVTVELTFTLR